ncbi:MAG TPA: hypothetical protein VHZ33_09460 [Trebonia sp.]|jgi:hypothetical protein|nr:hypothetical protein [Trebonia sp.]
MKRLLLATVIAVACVVGTGAPVLASTVTASSGQAAQPAAGNEWG